MNLLLTRMRSKRLTGNSCGNIILIRIPAGRSFSSRSRRLMKCFQIAENDLLMINLDMLE